MKKLLILIMLCLPLPLWAWNLQGHAVVAQIAYENISPETELKVDALADRVFAQLPAEEQQFLNRRGAQLSPYARAAGLPDTWTTLTLRQLFAEFHAVLPSALQPYADDRTAHWHFMNNAYGSNSYCHGVTDTQNVAWAIPLLQRAFAESQDPNAQAVILVLLTHFVGDIHQPLHVIVKTNWLCGNDGGGNGFCLKARRGACVLSLHKFWDSGLGYLKRGRNLDRAAADLQQKWPQSGFGPSLQESAPLTWVQDELKLADFVYGASQNHKPSPEYVSQGRKLAQQQLSLAGYRLARIISGLIAANSQNS